MMKKTQQGFTLIELMIVVAIIGILAAIAIPAYSNYTTKAKFTDVISSVGGLKTGIEACVADGTCLVGGYIDLTNIGYTGAQATGDLPAYPGGTANLASVTIDNTTPGSAANNGISGTITATATNTGGLNNETYVFHPKVVNGAVTWSVDPTSGCKIRPAGPIC